MLRITIVNGPNLNLLGRREPEIYGSLTFEAFLEALKMEFPEIQLNYKQSNVEGEIINFLHGCIGKCDAIIINPGAYTHTSIAIADAIKAINIPVLEVHISNTAAREDFRRVSFVAPVCVGSIIGLGLDGYRLAIRHFIGRHANF